MRSKIVMYDDTFEENSILFILLTVKVKDKISKYRSDLEDFIEENFPQHQELKYYFFKYKGQREDLIGLKVENSPFILLLKRSTDRRYNRPDNYFVAIDLQKREITISEDNDFIEAHIEVRIPINFDKYHREYSNHYRDLIDEICEKVVTLDYYQDPPLNENQEFQKWYAYLELLEKLIDEKDFYFEADHISYKKKQASIDIKNFPKELKEKIKKSRRETFLYYKDGEVDTNEPLHKWDEKDNRNRVFGNLKEVSGDEIKFELDEEFIKEFTNKEHQDIISMQYDDNEFALEARRYIEHSLKKINQNIVYRKDDEINVAGSIKNLKISQNDKEKLLDIWKKLSDHIHGNSKELNKGEIDDGLKVLKPLLPNEKRFNPSSKLILRVSYFREQFQLKTLKRGLDAIKRHRLKEYLFGNRKIKPISDNELNDLEIEFLSKKLNEKQKEAIKKALLSEDIFMIQGPPGTGKTEVIAEIAYQEAIRGKKVLITSQANMAVDNAIQRLNHPSLYPVRIIRKDYEPEDGDSLPIEQNIDKFYQDRIIKNLSESLELEHKDKKLIELFLSHQDRDDLIEWLDDLVELCGRLGIKIPKNLDLSNEYDQEDFIRIINSSINRAILQERLQELQDLECFRRIREDFLDEFRSDNSNIEEEKSFLKTNYLEKSNIYGATLFETGKRSFKDKKFDVVIVDEVSKATPPELILAILKAEKVILVGDHKQLPPIIKDVSLEELAEEIGVDDKSLVDFETTVFERLILNNPQSYVMLDTQYRMHPHIQMAIDQFYMSDENKEGLKCGLVNPDLDRCHRIEDPQFKGKHLIWIKTKDSDKEKREGTSYINQKEIELIEVVLKFLNISYKNEKEKPSVGVITFYGKQLGQLKNLEKPRFWELSKEERKYPNLDLRFGTVDRFQGQEKDIIIVSLVRNNDEKNIGFAKKPHRINVAFSRAKKLLIIVGNIDNFIFGKDRIASQQYKEVYNIAKKFGTVKAL